MSDPRCPICGFIFTRRWMYRLTKQIEKGVQILNRNRRRGTDKFAMNRVIVVKCEECGDMCPEAWDTVSGIWVSFSLRPGR